MPSLFSKVETFVFAAQMTQILEEHTTRRAVDGVFSERVLDADANGNSVRVGQSVGKRLSTIDHRAIVVIVGDGRNNVEQPNSIPEELVAAGGGGDGRDIQAARLPLYLAAAQRPSATDAGTSAHH